jgi:excisionase family DNA binding protein
MCRAVCNRPEKRENMIEQPDNRLLVQLTVTEFKELIREGLSNTPLPGTEANLIYGIPQLAKALNISLSVCKKMIAEKKIPFNRLSARKYCFDLNEVLKATASNKEVNHE